MFKAKINMKGLGSLLTYLGFVLGKTLLCKIRWKVGSIDVIVRFSVEKKMAFLWSRLKLRTIDVFFYGNFTGISGLQKSKKQS